MNSVPYTSRRHASIEFYPQSDASLESFLVFVIKVQVPEADCLSFLPFTASSSVVIGMEGLAFIRPDCDVLALITSWRGLVVGTAKKTCEYTYYLEVRLKNQVDLPDGSTRAPCSVQRVGGMGFPLCLGRGIVLVSIRVAPSHIRSFGSTCVDVFKRLPDFEVSLQKVKVELSALELEVASHERVKFRFESVSCVESILKARGSEGVCGRDGAEREDGSEEGC